MTYTNKGFLSLYISLLAVLILFNGCEDPGSVGSEFVDRPELTYDTLTISNTQVLNYKGYSGRLSFLPMGYYSDPIFGDVTARTLVKPSRVPAIPDSVELGDNFSLQLEFQIDSLQTYGDTLSSTGFTLYEITSPWRGRALRMDDQILYEPANQVGSFTVGVGQNKILVDNLTETWVDEYRCYFNNCNEEADIDSLYNYNFRGLIAIPDQSSSKLTFSQVNETRFIIINEEGTDTVAVPLRDWGYTFDRVGETTISNTFPLHTTLEGMLSITMPTSILKDKNDNKNIIRSDLVFYEAEDELTSSLPANHQRLRVQTLNLGLVAEDDPVYEYQFGEVPFFGSKSEEEASYQINVTNYVNNVLFGDETRQELILGIGSSSGALRSTLLYDETAPEQLRPKIIITSLAD